MEVNQSYWNQGKGFNAPFIPTLNVGWDYRPKLSDPSVAAWDSPLYESPTTQELATHLGNAIQWVNNNQNADPAKTIYVYSWSELGEGTWIVPTIFNGDAHLQAFAKILKGTYFTTPRFKARDLNGDHKIDISDYNILLRDFDKTLDPIPTNADITADGQVTMDDYNILVDIFNK